MEDGWLADSKVARRYDVHPRTLPRWDLQVELQFPKPRYVKRPAWCCTRLLSRTRAVTVNTATPQRARELRDCALKVLRTNGAWVAAGPIKLFVADIGDLTMGLRSVFSMASARSTAPNYAFVLAKQARLDPMFGPRHLVQAHESSQCRMG